jgi:hypothetical protein
MIYAERVHALETAAVGLQQSHLAHAFQPRICISSIFFEKLTRDGQGHSPG